MRTWAKSVSGLCFCVWLVIGHASAANGQTHGPKINSLNEIKNSGLAKNLWQFDDTPLTPEKKHKLLPVHGGNLCHAVNIHHVVLNFIDNNDYLRVVLPGSDDLYVQHIHRTESRFGIEQWSGEVVAHAGLIFSLFFDPAHKTYSSNFSLGAQDTWVIRTLDSLTIVCKIH